jgi:hypothetical protein
MKYVGIYNADGTIFGEISYVAKKLAGRGSCALCDITHGWTGRKKSFDDACASASIEIELLHRDEATPEQLAAATSLPAVIAQRDNQWVCVLGPADLEECHKDPEELMRRLVV